MARLDCLLWHSVIVTYTAFPWQRVPQETSLTEAPPTCFPPPAPSPTPPTPNPSVPWYHAARTNRVLVLWLIWFAPVRPHRSFSFFIHTLTVESSSFIRSSIHLALCIPLDPLFLCSVLCLSFPSSVSGWRKNSHSLSPLQCSSIHTQVYSIKMSQKGAKSLTGLFVYLLPSTLFTFYHFMFSHQPLWQWLHSRIYSLIHSLI